MDRDAGGRVSASDVWSEWLLEQRCGGDATFRKAMQPQLDAYRDRVLDGGRLTPTDLLLDVGAGDGLIAFGAIDRLGPGLRAILCDISAPLLRHAKATAIRRGIRKQCEFLRAGAENLGAIGNGTVDVVTTRASLAYVDDKPSAFAEFYRVLKPGGRMSLCEPINQDDAFDVIAMGRLIESQPNHPHIEYIRLLHRLKAAQLPSNELDVSRCPLTNFSERDLMLMSRAAGFVDSHLELHVSHSMTHLTTWATFLRTAPHPGTPTVELVMAEHFTPAERKSFEQVMRPVIESGRSLSVTAVAYLTAVKPLD